MRLQGKTALITGGSTGIGQAIAETFASEGAKVVFTGRDARRGKLVAEGIQKAGGLASFIEVDLDSTTAVDRLVKETNEAVGHVDILVNNAATYTFNSTAQTSEADFDAIFKLNVKVPFYLTAALAPKMVERGSGKIINITTMVAHVGESGMAAYGASKAALTLLTKSWAAEFASSGVNVNAIAPGPTTTQNVVEVMGEAFTQMGNGLPAKRVAAASEIADAALYLASNESNFVHGATIPVDGGRIAV